MVWNDVKNKAFLRASITRDVWDAAITVIYMVACQQVHIFVTGNECPRSWREKRLSSDVDKIGYLLWMGGEAPEGELYSQLFSLLLEALPRAFHDRATSRPSSCEVFPWAHWLWEQEAGVKFSIWLSGFGWEILVSEMSHRSPHKYLPGGREIHPGRTKESFLSRRTEAVQGSARVWRGDEGGLSLMQHQRR